VVAIVQLVRSSGFRVKVSGLWFRV
jgi:hypothetical protein